MLSAIKHRRITGAKEIDMPLTFTALEDNSTVQFYIASPITTEMVEYVEYSMDNGRTWTKTYNRDGVTVEINLPRKLQEGESVMFRGSGSTYAVETSSSQRFSYFRLAEGKVKASGNIMSMLNPHFKNLKTIIGEYAFSGMFANNETSLIEPPLLPATTLSKGCYETMFYNCKALTISPALPATILAEKCYYSMFDLCNSLATVPELPATQLANNCYGRMFARCSSITTAPALPATQLAEGCYSNMFQNCTSLVTAPALPVTDLKYMCYSYMFSGCTSLINAPALPAMDLTIVSESGGIYYGVYDSMFSGCTSLVNPPELPATTLSNYCYEGMFRGCTSLVESPVLLAQTLKSSCYKEMFYGCTLLNKITMLGTYLSGALSDWVRNVAAAGTFVKRSDVTNIPSGNSGIPNGWTVEDYVG